MQAGNHFFWPGTYLLNEYRQFGLPNPHRRDSRLWPLLPFDIPDDILFEYLALIDDFIYKESGETMFIHGFVVLPVPVTAEVRQAFHLLFILNIPEQVQDFVNGIRFRFLFYHDEHQPSFNVTTRYVLSYGEPIMCNFLGTPLEPRVIMLENGLLEFRDQGRAFETHNSLTTSWNILPYPVNPVHWFTYYVMLRSFSDDMFYRTIPDNSPILYLRANVYSPLNVQLNAMYRFCIYKMFLFNTPPELYFLISRIRFRFFFMGTTAIPRDEIFIENLSYSTEYSAPRYFNLEYEM